MSEPDPAVRRFWILQAARFGAVLMVLAGAAIIGQLINVPQPVGYILLVLGAAEFFIVPMMLSKAWKSD
ncbi:hypothetical protein [Qipengyuania sphaerica]|uniref:hypothetical protein n=1 Tax=Qipengyuania sphaerica TaxID=2867243 RepID=UPI001C8673A1|nr:hypothetical protein [Qipengyuania sphaerica]MBX7539931.1 hypothetical protein [Qipengyuania sphaerica]